MEGEVRRDVRWFALAMERELRRHDLDRGTKGWVGDRPETLLRRLLEEAGELGEAVGWYLRVMAQRPRPPEEERREARRRVLKEASDVGNFAMMIADVVRALEALAVEDELARVEARRADG